MIFLKFCQRYLKLPIAMSLLTIRRKNVSLTKRVNIMQVQIIYIAFFIKKKIPLSLLCIIEIYKIYYTHIWK